MTFASGDPLDASPAVIFIDPDSGAATAWVLPDTAVPGVRIAPDGQSIFWLAQVPGAEFGRSARADELFDELTPHLSAEQRARLRPALDALVATQPGDDSWVPVAAEIVDDIRADLPREVADSLKDRLSDIAQPPPSGFRWHLLRTSDGADRTLNEVTSPPIAFEPVTGAFVAGTLASEQGTEGPAVFSASGERLMELPSHRTFYPPTFSSQGSAAYVGYNPAPGETGTITLYTLATLDADPVEVLSEPILAHQPLSLAWAPDGDRFALVTVDRVRVFTAAGEPIWQVSGAFEGNPRWSSRGFLHVYGGSVAIEHGVDERLLPVAYVFDDMGAPVFRLRWFGSCNGDPWLSDGSGLQDGQSVVLLDGDVERLEDSDLRGDVSPTDPNITLRWEEEASARALIRVRSDVSTPLVTLAPDVSRYHLENPWTEDGRYIISTAVTDTAGGCGEGWTAPLEPPTVEQPPYPPVYRPLYD